MQEFNQHFDIQDEGTICLLVPLTDWAVEWLDQHINEDDSQWFGPAVVVEPRYLSDIVDGICEGLSGR